MKKINSIIVLLLVTVLFTSCSKPDKEYKMEARYFYDRVQELLEASHVDKELEEAEDLDYDAMGMFADTVLDAYNSAVGLEELIATQSTREAINNSYTRLEELYVDKGDIGKIHVIVELLYDEISDMKELLENPKSVSDLKQAYVDHKDTLQKYADELYGFVKDETSAEHTDDVDNEIEVQ